MTPWGETVTAENAWRGYPRPQMVRPNWTNLNGEWSYAVTSVTNTPGRPEKWDGRILVPFPLESTLSGVGRVLRPDEFLWYTRKIVCDPKPGERILLHFGAVDFRAMVFIGHDEVTDVPHEGGQAPFTLDITDFVTRGENDLTVCVWDPTEDFINSRGKQSFEPKRCFYTRVSGIWQTVWMENVPERYIKSYRVFTDIDEGTVRFEFDKVEGAGDVEVTTDLPQNFECWSPENPKLYNFTAKYGRDEIKGYFGMRKIEKRKDARGHLRFFLNNRPYFPIGTLDQGWWPDGLLTPPSAEAMEYDVKVLKDCGFNMLRKHIKVEPQQYYAMCDRLGILVIQDLPSGGSDFRDPTKPETVRGYGLQRVEMKEMMDSLQTFPSIVMWNPYNEGWTQPGEFLTHAMLDFTRRHDRTRLVNGPSGCWDWEGGHLLPRGWAWTNRVTTAHRPDGVCEAADTVDLHLYRGPAMLPVNDRRISFLGEFGGLGHPVAGHLWSESKDEKGNWGYGGIADTATREGLGKAYLGLMDKLGELAENGLGGSVYTQTTDVETEINGLMTYDRKVLKFDPQALRSAHEAVVRRATSASADAAPEPWNLDAREKFAAQRFGIFVHWGLYSNYAQGEWYQHALGVGSGAMYGRMKDGFCPSKFDAREWIRVFKDSGAKYVTVTARHHDGFSLWPTTADDGYNIAETPFGRDILGELSEACDEAGMQLNFYYSLMDWHRSDYPAGEAARKVFGAQKGDYASYKRFMLKQIGELIDGYHPGCIWFDGEWDHAKRLDDGTWNRTLDWDFDAIYDFIHAKKTLVANNNHQPIRTKEDIQLFERDLPGENSDGGFSGNQPVAHDRPVEQCDVIQPNVWGYRIRERKFRSPQEVCAMICRCAAKDSNLLMNIGPDGSGRLPEKAVETMAEVGRWMRENGEAIYATRGLGLEKDADGNEIGRTRKGDTLYVITIPKDGGGFPKVERRCAPASNSGAWGASEWISAPNAPVAGDAEREACRAADGTSWFVHELKNEGEIKSATWMTTGLGVYELYVNGKSVGGDILKPGYTHVKKTRRSFTYDVTALLRKGRGESNFLAAEVSSGWWRDKIVNYAGEKSAFRAVLLVTYADGTVKSYGTKAGEWKAGVAGPVTHAGIFDGEEYDARNERPFFGRADLQSAERNDEFSGDILPSEGGEVRLRTDKTLAPVSAYAWEGTDGADPGKEIFGRVHKMRDVRFDGTGAVRLAKGETLVVDFGQNCAAVPAFKFRAAEGTVLTCLPGEMLNEANGERSRGNDGPAGSVYRENLRIPDLGMRIRYVFGEAKAQNDGFVDYRPAFSFFGYRYVSVTATADVEIREIKSIPVSSITKEMELGSLVTGVESVNKLISNVYWGQLSNYLSVPTDCPQRNERLGWSADTQVFCEAGAFNADTRAFFRKWTRDLRDSQSDEGGYTAVAPYALLGNLPFAFGWADAGVIVPYQLWKQFGDREIIDDNFDAMEKFVRRLDETKYDFEGKLKYIYADWLSYQTFETRGNQYGDWTKWKDHPDAQDYRRFLAACYWRYDAALLAQMAEATGRDATWFKESEKRAVDYIRGRFLETDGLLLKPMRELQTACVFALRFGIVENEAKDATLAILLKSIREHGDCLQTGFLGTSFLMETLSMCGRTDVAYSLLLQRKVPSWLYPVEHGATTVWERWNSYTAEEGFGPVMMNSFNHYAYGAVLAWMYKDMAGIAADPEAPGFKNIVMAPKPDRRMGFVTAEYKSAAGLIKSAWRYEGDDWIWDFTIPEGATADVAVPGEKVSHRYQSGTYTIKKGTGK